MDGKITYKKLTAYYKEEKQQYQIFLGEKQSCVITIDKDGCSFSSDNINTNLIKIKELESLPKLIDLCRQNISGKAIGKTEEGEAIYVGDTIFVMYVLDIVQIKATVMGIATRKCWKKLENAKMFLKIRISQIEYGRAIGIE